MEEKKKLVEARCYGGRTRWRWSMALREEDAVEAQERRPQEARERRRSLKNKKGFRNL